MHERNAPLQSDERVIVEVCHNQLQHFTASDGRCRGLELPDGLLLRYLISDSLYFYLRSGVESGSIATCVYASDSPYDRQKTLIGTVRTPMLESTADQNHLAKVEALVRSWIDFVSIPSPDDDELFRSFPVGNQ